MIIKMKKNGFTLIEIIIAMAIGAVIMTAIYASMNLAQKSSASVGRKVATQQDARLVLDLMSMEIRMASYNPTRTTNLLSTIPTGSCTSITWPSPVSANRGILVAESNRILVAMDLGGDGVIGCNTAAAACAVCCGPPNTCTNSFCAGHNEYIEYTYVGGTTGTIFRNIGGTSCSGDTAILGGVGSTTMVRNDQQINPVTGATPMPMFQYFDGAGAATTSIPAIRRIRITIVADTESNDSLTNQPKRMTNTTDVLVKNHVLSSAW